MNLLGQPIRVGDVVHTAERLASPETCTFHLDTFGDPNPLYHTPAHEGPTPAPPLLFHSEVYEHPERWYLRNLFGNLHARQEWLLYAPIRAGEKVLTRSLVAERYRRRDRDYVVNEVDYCDAAGRLLVRGRTHQSFLVDRRDAEAGFVVDREAASAKERRPVGEGPGRRLEPIEWEVTNELCWRFSGPGRNYHTDRDEARKLGFPEIVVQGMLSTCFVSQLLGREYGAGWLRGGRMDVKLVNVLWAGERVRACGRAHAEVPEGDATRHHLEVWVEKLDAGHTPVIVGAASALRGDLRV